MKNYGFRFFVILAIAALCVWQFASKGVRLGLDLAGGSSLTYAVRAEEALTAERLDKAIEVITKRVNATGLSEIFITSTAQNQIVVEMPRRSPTEVEDVKSLIQRNGQLEFRIQADTADMVEERRRRDETPPKIYDKTLEARGLRWVPLAHAGGGNVPGAEDVLVKVPEAPLHRKYLDLLAAKGAEAEETKDAFRKWDAMRRSEVFRGEDMETPHLDYDKTQIVVAFSFKDHRKNDFKDFTARNVDRQMAIILDGKVDSAPNINETLPGRGQITGGGKGFTEKEANALRIVLESGSTGVQLELEREETLGASLGQVAVDRGKWSILIGVLIVVVLMLIYYRVPGIIANAALLLNVVIVLGLMAFFRGAMSLPGIAGIVLTIGMAIDANILIFERLRDERKRGKTLQESLAAAYDNAMSAIVDGNVTTLITGLVLMWLGSGAVRGFGTTLTIGLLASMFTAVWVTRVIFGFLIDMGWLRSFEIGNDPKERLFAYMRLRRYTTLPSIALVIAGVAGFLVRDEDKSKDLEFVGGQSVVIQLAKPYTADEITRIAKGPDRKWEDATAVAIEPAGTDAADGTRWQIRTKAVTEAKGKEFVEYLQGALADSFVAPAFSDWEKVAAPAGATQKLAFTVHTLRPVEDLGALKTAIERQGATGVEVAKAEDAGDLSAFRITIDAPDGGEVVAAERTRKAIEAPPVAVHLSEPVPSSVYLSPVEAERLWRNALEAILVALLFQVLYIRVRFADYTHGFAAAIALVHDVAIALGAVALFDSLGIVYAKVNLVLVAAFLTLIGYSMNDTIVVFDRIRENLGRSKVIRSRIVDDSINQMFERNIRTGIAVFGCVMAQFWLNRNLGSVLEGFAFVMFIGLLAGTYSSIFIASPLLLFLPGYTRKLTANRWVFVALCVAAVVGALVAVTAQGHGVRMWIGFLMASLIPLHFLAHLIPWLGHPDPDTLVVEETAVEAGEPPLITPGV